MSRVGKKLIKIPEKVKVTAKDGRVHVEGPKGKMDYNVPSVISVEITGGEILLKKNNEETQTDVLHGTTRANLHNMVVGVSTGFEKHLDIVGVGYKADAKGDELTLNLGYSHPIIYKMPHGVAVKVEKQTRITLAGCDRQQVGEVAAKVRAFRSPEPYKGKGIRYKDEVVKIKVGKAAASTTGS